MAIDIQKYVDEINKSVEEGRPTMEEYVDMEGEVREYKLPWDTEKIHLDCDYVMRDILERLGYTEVLKAIDDAEEACGGFGYA